MRIIFGELSQNYIINEAGSVSIPMSSAARWTPTTLSHTIKTRRRAPPWPWCTEPQHRTEWKMATIANIIFRSPMNTNKYAWYHFHVNKLSILAISIDTRLYVLGFFLSRFVAVAVSILCICIPNMSSARRSFFASTVARPMGPGSPILMSMVSTHYYARLMERKRAALEQHGRKIIYNSRLVVSVYEKCLLGQQNGYSHKYIVSPKMQGAREPCAHTHTHSHSSGTRKIMRHR